MFIDVTYLITAIKLLGKVKYIPGRTRPREIQTQLKNMFSALHEHHLKATMSKIKFLV